jgi:outer membrane lipoprotein carrier protein
MRVLLLTIALATTLHAQDAHLLAARVDAHYNHLQSFQADYAEHYTGMGVDRTETGTLLLQKPGRMRWSYNQPAGKIFVLDGKFAYFYAPGDTQAQRIPAKELDDLHSPLRFLLGHTQLEKEMPGLIAAPSANGQFTLTGVPKTMAQRIRALTLTVTTDGVIQRIRISETDGSVTDFTFTALRENPPISAANFTFRPPPGVEIVNGLPPI